MLRLYNDFDRRRASCEAGQKRTGWDGWASTRASLAKPEWGTQKAIERRTRVANPAACAAFHPSIDRLKEQPSGGLGWPTQQLAPCFIRPSIASRECPQSAKAKAKRGRARCYQTKTTTTGAPGGSRLPPRSIVPTCLLQIEANSKQCQRSWIRGEGPLSSDAKFRQGNCGRQSSGEGLGWPARTGFPAFSSPVQ